MKLQSQRKESDFTTYTDGGGRTLVRLDVGRGKSAVLTYDDWDRVREDFGATWCLNNDGHGRDYVVAQHPKRKTPITLARAIMNPPRNRRVSYRDGNRFNLLPENLRITPGPAKRPALSPTRA